MGVKDSLAKNLVIYMEQKGLDPFYVMSIFCILICLSFRKDIKNWYKLPNDRKIFISGGILGTIVAVIMALARLMGFR